MTAASSSFALTINARTIDVPAGVTVAAAIALACDGVALTRRAVGGAARAPLCGMGVCHECRVTIDGRAHQLSCQTLCTPGMRVQTLGGAA